MDGVPVYVRAGAIVPEAPVVQFTSEIPKGPLQILVYPGPDCRGSLYQDDGNTLAYQRGDFLRVQFACDSGPDTLKLNFLTPQARYRPWWTSMRVTFFGVPAKSRELRVDGKAWGICRSMRRLQRDA